MAAILVLIACLALYAFVFKLFEIKDRAKEKHENELRMQQLKKDDDHEIKN